MTFTIDIQNEPAYALDQARLCAAAAAVLSGQNAHPDSALTVVFASDDFVAALNRQYRGLDAPTDVLSFPADPPPVVIPDEPPYLGDLIIAYPYARQQAARENHPLDDSLCLLVIHGTLHLLGFDHDTDDQRAAMWAAQEAALNTLSISPAIVPALEQAADDDTH